MTTVKFNNYPLNLKMYITSQNMFLPQNGMIATKCIFFICADTERVPKKSQNIGFLSNTGPDPLENHKATKPAFNVGPSCSCSRRYSATVGIPPVRWSTVSQLKWLILSTTLFTRYESFYIQVKKFIKCFF